MLGGQVPWYETDEPYFLSYYLCTYLGYHAPNEKREYIKVLTCPSTQLQAPDPTDEATRHFHIIDPTLPDGSTLLVFGYPGGSGKPKIGPVKRQRLDSLSSAANMYCLTEPDKVGVDEGCDWQYALPDRPVHGKVRNYLFFDSHVQAIAVGPPGQVAPNPYTH